MFSLSVPTKSGPVAVEGELLGEASTHRPHHDHSEGEAPAPGGPRCSACRWTEVTILDDAEADEYVLIVVGMSSVPGEEPRGWLERTDSPTWAVECLRRPVGGSGKLGLPTPARKALALAADRDEDLKAAYHAASK